MFRFSWKWRRRSPAKGDGLRLFGGSLTEERWDLKNVVAYKNGFVGLSYSASTA